MSRPLPASYIPVRESWEMVASYTWEHAFRCGGAHEAALIVKFLRGQTLTDHTEHRITQVIAGWIERGEHLDGLREGGGATRPSLGDRPPQPGSGT